ncbi:MbcA/ParS/Xre antitoxin family protein [Roseisolibacter sp. H3M3-2]|uniref:MbcA/ParS/Xre antitoxin family protein n=1 Tax=Roseisolibacter sp. H3M3-2 TaxID=3031323 RepID=UPI0023DB3288|nr:MbcA/ParS/Xre antitoxin family protein [Roseisolibacter sp. H3M3-2]MDF1503869.1 MbcA/ParS/Xre antitoxin family protein [Roseisolibacter sp. H3M3-2]
MPVQPAVPGRPDPEAPDALSAPALRTFFRIADVWRLTPGEQMTLLGGPPRSTFYKWREGSVGRLPRDVLERVSYVFGIYKALQILFPDAARADQWIRRPNAAPPFGGRSALDRMLSGNVGDLFVVRQYLDAQRGGWP